MRRDKAGLKRVELDRCCYPNAGAAAAANRNTRR
jgi:hypothetical protein